MISKEVIINESVHLSINCLYILSDRSCRSERSVLSTNPHDPSITMLPAASPLLYWCLIRLSSKVNCRDQEVKETGLTSPPISLCGDRRLKDPQNRKSEDRRLQNCQVLRTENLATKQED